MLAAALLAATLLAAVLVDSRSPGLPVTAKSAARFTELRLLKPLPTTPRQPVTAAAAAAAGAAHNPLHHLLHLSLLARALFGQAHLMQWCRCVARVARPL